MFQTASSALKVFQRLLQLEVWRRRGSGDLARERLAVLQESVGSAVGRVPYYREVTAGLDAGAWTPAGFDQFRAMPPTSKAAVKAHFPDGMVAEGLDWSRLYSVATSGTTDRVMLFEDEERRNWDRAADLLIKIRANGFRPGQRALSMPPDACYEHCGADGRMVTFTVGENFRDWRRARGAERGVAARRLRNSILSEYLWRERRLPSLGVDGTAVSEEILEDYCRQIREWAPTILNGLPMGLYVVALFALKKGYGFPSVRIVRPNGGKFSAVMAETVARAFDATVRENYGSAELSSMAMDCAASRDQHLFEGIFHLEVLRFGEPVHFGELGELVVSDMRNRVTPLLRYQIGDVGRLEAGCCTCGFEGTRFVVDGRIEETVVTPDGHAVTGMELVDLFLRRPEIDHVRFLQEADDLFLAEVVPAPGHELPAAAEMEASLGELLRHPVRLRMRKVRRVAPERNGKYRLVLSNSHDRFHLRSQNA
jgi:phenylacetate-coenzyme A ligase PaaK-like adenylate-forming protein